MERTRSKLQNATQAARRLLEEDFDQQLEGIYDILPDGEVVAAPGAHLDARGRLLRNKLVAAFGTITERGLAPKAARAMLLREAAFTTLNRFAALKLAEARKVIRESVAGGDQSSGFKEFCTLAAGLVALPDKGYRLYIECIFDEVGREVRVLFDRREVAGILWPRPPALAGLLDILNSADLAGVWSRGRDAGLDLPVFQRRRRTPPDARRIGRTAEQPRVGRAQPVFHPALRGGFSRRQHPGAALVRDVPGPDTSLKSECEYLVYRPNEVFLAAGEQEPEPATADSPDNRPVYIPHRMRKDPRDIKVIDIGVGSAHFLMYCFGLFLDHLRGSLGHG